MYTYMTSKKLNLGLSAQIQKRKSSKKSWGKKTLCLLLLSTVFSEFSFYIL